MDKVEIALLILMMGCMLFLGWASNEIYEDWTMEKKLSGLYLHYSPNWAAARETAKDLDSGGDWVCINSLGMDYDDCVETARHECAHEAFAEICEEDENQDKCREFINSNG